MKLCKDCKHSRKGPFSLKCNRPLGTHSMVDGLEHHRYQECYNERDGDCGEEAKYFEQKVGFFNRVFSRG